MPLKYRRILSFGLVLCASVYFAYLEFRPQTTGDYGSWYAPTMNALLSGHVGLFLHNLPMTAGAGGSVILRAPAALVGKLLIGSELGQFRVGALLCELAAGALGLWLAREMRRRGRPPVARAAVILVSVLGPAKIDAIYFGHPEEILGATLAVASVLLAGRGRMTLAGLALGLAVVNKPWGALALLPALLAASGGRRRMLLVAAGLELAWVAIAAAAGTGTLSETLAGATVVVVAHPVDIWWPLAHLYAPRGVTPAYFPPNLVAKYAHDFAMLLAIPFAIPLARRRRPSTERCLALLALLFLLRCALDPSNHVYYQVPFLMALIAWDALMHPGPILALAGTLGFWLVFHTVSGVAGLNVQYAAYLSVTLPFVVILCATVVGKPIDWRALVRGGRRAAARLQPALPAAVTVAGAVYVAWLGFRRQPPGDYDSTFAPAMNALIGGHLHAFLAQLPPDGAGGSVLLRAPAAAIGKLFGGAVDVYRFGALACVLASGALGLWLARGMRAAARPPVARAAVVGLCVLAPGLLDAIFYGHPEEPLGASMCIASVLLAGGGRAGLSGAALGLAIITKPWAVFAVAPALLALRGPRRWLFAGGVGIPAVWLASTYLGSPGTFSHSFSWATTATIAHPVDLWWPFATLRVPPGVTPAYYAPAFLAAHARELAVLATVPIVLGLARARERTTESCLGLLALGFLLRCLLDPSNHVYYQVPFVLSLTAWEARSSSSAPALGLLATGLLWLVFHTISGVAGLEVQFAAYLSVTVPFLIVLVLATLGVNIRGEMPIQAPWPRPSRSPLSAA